MTIPLREYFAAHCPDNWLQKYMPHTIGDVADEMLRRGIITAEQHKREPIRRYERHHEMRLEISYRWQYADMMIEGNKNRD